MSHGFFKVPAPTNEPVAEYAPGSPERARIKARLAAMAAEEIEIPLIIGGKEVTTGKLADCIMPHDHHHRLARYHEADVQHVAQAIEAAEAAWREWSEWPWEERAAVFLKAGELLAGPFRDTLNGATMLGQSKTVFQAEIDSACELIDFYRFNPYYLSQIMSEQPMFSPSPTWNRCEYRALEGFIFAVTPFNFTSIAGNLPTAPAIMGNTALWKPSHTAIYSGYYIMKLLEAAGMPGGVINFIPGPSSKIAPPVLTHRRLAGIHFTGSTGVFQDIWRTIGENIATYDGYPRIVGETGGKDFVLVHESADASEVATALLRGAFEFQGQKCSAASRAYVPRNLWPKVMQHMTAHLESLKMGDVRDFSNFMAAVIDRRAFDKIVGYIDRARDATDARILAGGESDDRTGYFIQPTVIETSNPTYPSMCEEIFGPVLTVHSYNPDRFEETLQLCDRTSPYALTGAVFARDRAIVARASKALRHAAGNFYINDKPTGAVVGQQPFGGGRASGTNDKAGSQFNLLRWTSVRSIKENFLPVHDYGYPHMLEP